MNLHLFTIFLFLYSLLPFADLFSTNFIESHKWETNNTINYGFQLPLEYTVEQINNFKGAVYLAIEEFNDSVENLFTFKEFNVSSPTFKKYIIFSDMQGDSGECSKTYASKKGLIRISFNSLSACRLADLQHDIMRALGFQLENMRADNSKYIRVNRSCIFLGEEHRYTVCENSCDISFSSYDLCSILHLRKDSFRISSRCSVFEPLDDIGCPIGQRNTLTYKDARKVKAIYQK